MENNGIKVISAKCREDVVKVILQQIGNEKLIVKSKSNVTKEIELTTAA